MNIFCLLLAVFMLQDCAKKDIVLISDPEVISIPIVENDEPLVDLRNQSVIAYGPSPEIEHNTDYTKVRRAVYEKLIYPFQIIFQG
ncbi:MAG: hypothetical protein NTX76_06470 [Alphaproteobacteria bacterium]|nr:hypothetical protein [Alphaproteobacteria bacterium]